MAWRNPFTSARVDENTRNVWGYSFQWTPDHLSEESLHPQKFSYDILAEEALMKLDEISPPARSPTAPKRDLYALLRDHASQDEKLGELWEQVNTVPDFVDWDQIARGQDVFYRYGGVALTALAYQSLLGGMGAARVTETLARTGGFSVKVAKAKLYETTQHILQVTKSLDSIKPGGEGHASSVRVRLLHASVRRRIMQLASSRPSYYSIEDYGIPINDLDSIATISTFSSTLIWIGFPRQGIFLRKQEIEDYIALWRLVAWYLGTPTDYFESPKKARIIMESIFLSEIRPSETSRILANNVILALESQPPAYASRDFLLASARWLNGKELSDALGLGNPGYYYWSLVAGQCIFFMCLCYTNRSIPAWDRKKINMLRRIFWHVIVENKDHGLGEASTFDFKYIPDYNLLETEKGIYEASNLKSRGVERRNFRAFVLASAGFGLLSYLCARLGWGLLMNLRRL